MVDLVWLIPALPLAGFLLLLVVRPPARRAAAPAGSPPRMVGGVVRRRRASCSSACATRARGPRLHPDAVRLDPGRRLQRRRRLPRSTRCRSRWCLFITGIGTLIHLYSIGYMHGDPKFSKFFLYLNLFVFSMLMLVLGNNLLVTFLGWEGVGACSYFLISFWFEKDGQRHRPARRPSSPTASATGASWSAMFLTFFTLRLAQLHRGPRRGARASAATTATAIVAAAVRRRRRQVGPAAAVRLAARRHGRPHAGVGPDPRRHHGHRRRLPAWSASTRCSPRPTTGLPDAHRLGRRASPRCSPPPSPSPRTTSRRCSPTRRSASSATCSWPSASAPTWPPSST